LLISELIFSDVENPVRCAGDRGGVVCRSHGGGDGDDGAGRAGGRHRALVKLVDAVAAWGGRRLVQHDVADELPGVWRRRGARLRRTRLHPHHRAAPVRLQGMQPVRVHTLKQIH
jgi:hypothetical protein